jgi:hypothetical protein
MKIEFGPEFWTSCCVLALLAGRSTAQPPHLPDEGLPAMLRAPPLADAPGDSELRRLLKARYNEGAAETRALLSIWELGRGALEEVCARGERLADAGLDLAERPADRVLVMSQYLELTRFVEKLVQQKIDAGIAASTHLHRARFHRLDAEIKLLLARRGAQ